MSAFKKLFVNFYELFRLGYSAVIMATINFGRDYLLIFDHYGFPEMGIAGPALASVIAEGVSVLFFVVAAAYN